MLSVVRAPPIANEEIVEKVLLRKVRLEIIDEIAKRSGMPDKANLYIEWHRLSQGG